MIETVIREYLSTKLSVPVYLELPENPTGKLIVLEKTGSGQNGRLYTPMMAVQSYADTLYEAAELNEDVKKAMAEAASLENVSKCTLNSDYNYTDTSTKRYRYQAVYQLVHNEFI